VATLFNILIVEDRPADAQLLVHELRRSGMEFRWRCVDSEADYLAALDQQIDLILSDYQLPSFDAMRALELLAERGLSIPLIVVSGTISEDVAVACMRNGAADYLFKDRLARLSLAVGQAIERRRAGQAQLNLQALNRAVFGSLPARIAVLDQAGVIMATNPAWERFANENGDPTLAGTGIGIDYLAVCRAAAATSADAAAALAGIEAVLQGQRALYSAEYRCDTPTGEFWYQQQVTPLGSPHGGAVIAHTDITARKLAERERIATAERLAGIIESAMDAIISVDESLRITVFNAAAEHMFRCSAEDVVGQPLDRFLPPFARHSHQRHIEAFGATGITSRAMHSLGVLTAIRADGIEFPIEATISQIVAEGAKIYTVIIRDITERKRAEAALRESEARFRSAYEHAPIGMSLVGLDGRWLEANRALCEMVGYSEQELRELTFYDITHPDDLAADFQAHEQLLAGTIASIQLEKRYFHKQGHTIWVALNASIIRDAQGQPHYYVAQIQNITARKRSDEMQMRLAAIVDSSDDAILSKSSDGQVMSWNAGAERIFGYTAAEMIGQSIMLIVPPDRSDEEARIFARLRSDERINHYETVRLCKDGRPIDVSLTISPIRDLAGKLTGASTIARDISERKQAENALRRQTAFVQLLQAVAVAANQATSFEQALQTTIDQVCVCIGWPVGHVYLAEDQGSRALISSNIWHFSDPQRFAIFQTITEAIHHAGVDDLPGRVLLSGQPEWIADMTEAPNMPRAKLIRDIGVRAGFAFPVQVGVEVVAVLEFFAPEAIAPDAALLDLMAHVGTELSRVVERARGEAALRASEERYRLIAENTSDVITLTDLRGAFVYLSPASEQLLGHDAAAMVGVSVYDVMHPDDVSHFQEQWQRTLADGFGRLSMRMRHVDGSWRWLESHATVIDQHGTAYVVGISRDVTTRRHSDEALRAAEAKYRALVEQIPAIIYTAELDEHSSTRYVSPQIKTILGFTQEEWLANPGQWIEQIHPDDRASALVVTRYAQSSDVPVPDEQRWYTRDGQMIWLQDTARVVRDEAGRPLFLQGIMFDITERKQAEEAVRASVRLYRTLASNFPNGAVMLFDRDLRYTIADGASLSAHGMSRDRVEGRTLYEVLPHERAVVLEPLYRAALDGISNIIELASGDRIYQTHFLPVKNEQDEIFAGLVVSQDITELKRAQQALVEERAQLARRVAKRTADLSAANAELARAARLKDEFLASMSHELRTPLNAILGLSEALQEQVYGPLSERQVKTLLSIEESGRHLLELINDILDLAKIGAGKLELTIEPVALEPLCQACLRLVRQAAQKKQLKLAAAIDPAVVQLNGDARRLKQVLINLLSNAVKFTPEGGSIGLEVIGDRARQVAQLSVWDTGIGIPAEQIEQLFQPFVQLDSRLARQYEGTGLGLALVYRMVEMHGGSIEVQSMVGAGSRFTVSLPWLPDDVVAPRPVAREQPARRAVIVDLVTEAAEQLAGYLRELGVEVVAQAHADDALAQAAALQPDMLLIDMSSAEQVGREILAQLKADQRTHAIPVMLIVAPGAQVQGLASATVDFLLKPFTFADVQHVFEALGSADRSASLAVRASPDELPPVVLLAEDNEANIATLSDYLDAHGYQVVVARNGAEAITRVRETRPAIVLMDIQMPGMDGLEAIRRLRSDGDLPQMPIIALTALAMPGDRERCLQAGASDYYSKPISLKGLLTKLETYLH
jgi:PAS domain S-box-containing protein